MEILDTTQACFVVDDDLLNFTLDGGEVEGKVLDPTILKGGASASSSSLDSSSPEAAASFDRGNQTRSFPEFVEEELEWLSNKDAFPAVETCFGILSDNPELILSHQSPVSVLESRTNSSNNSNTNSSNNNNNNNNSISVASCCNSLKVPTSYPVRARTQRSRRRRDLVHHSLWPSQQNIFKKNSRDISFSLPPAPVMLISGGAGGMGRRCLHCQADKTPQWRAGPMGPKTLCNACGVRYKSGRLLPEYRPANSPTFSSVLHSNSHRKVVEMRKLKQVGPGEGTTVNVATSCGYSVG